MRKILRATIVPRTPETLLGRNNPSRGKNFFGRAKHHPRDIFAGVDADVFTTQPLAAKHTRVGTRTPETTRDARNDGRRSLGPSAARKALLRDAIVRRNEP